MGLKLPAIEGGAPVREKALPYARQSLGDEELVAIKQALDSGWITTGPKVAEFEKGIAKRTGARHAVAVTSCTAALHLALSALGIGPGDEVVTTPLTFAATALAIMYAGAKPVLADIDDKTLNINPLEIEKKITPRTKALLPVHYGGNPCDMDAIMGIAKPRGLLVVEDAAHAIGATYKGREIGVFGNATCFSFHAVKNMTTAEGGAVTVADEGLAANLVAGRFFGITSDAWQRAASEKPWEYDVSEYGFKYNLTDIQAAMGLVQLGKLDSFLARRKEITEMYDKEFSALGELSLIENTTGAESARHLYVIRIRPERFKAGRDRLLAALRAEGISANVHYKPIHLHSFFAGKLDVNPGDFPVCEKAAEEIITLPLFPDMTDGDAGSVVEAVKKLVDYYRVN